MLQLYFIVLLSAFTFREGLCSGLLVSLQLVALVLFGLYGEKNQTFALLDQLQHIGHHGLVLFVAGSASTRVEVCFIFMFFEFFLVIFIRVRAVIVIRIRIIVLDAAAGVVQELREVRHHEELLHLCSSKFLARRVDFHLVTEVVVIER